MPRTSSPDYREVVANDLVDAWDKASRRYREIDNEPARLNVRILEQLRLQWQDHVRPDTSMFTLLFTRPDETGYDYTERVEVKWEAPDRVRLALVREMPRRGETRPAGPKVVTGDFTKPANTLPTLEALLFQLARRATVP